MKTRPVTGHLCDESAASRRVAHDESAARTYIESYTKIISYRAPPVALRQPTV